MAKTIAQLRTEAQTIKNATMVGENTATRVGGFGEDIVDFLEDGQDDTLYANGNADLDITDENGNVLARFEGGDFEVKNFATKIFAFLDSVPDFAISDTNGKMLVEVKNGNVFTKNFSSAPLYGKKVSFLGDSITTFSTFQGSNNPYYTGSNAGVTNVDMTWWKMLVNGQGGIFNRIYAYGGGDIVNNLCLRYNYLYNHGTYGIEPDVIFILGGINDWYHNKTLGTLDDAENSNSTFFAAYKYLLKNIKVTYPNATIIGLTPMNSMIHGTTIPYVNSNGVSIRQFCDAVIACCDYYSVLSVDLNKLVNINGNNYTTYLDDNTHPNYQGMIKVAKAISLNIINKII